MSAQIFGLTDVTPEVLTDFVALRKAKKAPLTATAVKALRVEAEKAGMTLDAVLSLCCQRGWTGFQAAWLLAGGGAASAAIQVKKSGRHSGFEKLDYNEGISADGSIN